MNKYKIGKMLLSSIIPGRKAVRDGRTIEALDKEQALQLAKALLRPGPKMDVWAVEFNESDNVKKKRGHGWKKSMQACFP